MTKIGVITSHIESLYLFRTLQQYDFSYNVYYDQEGWDWFDKPIEFVEKRVSALMDRAIADGMNHVILPPTLELLFAENKKYGKYILPLFSMYVLEYCLPYSYVGKIWFLGDWFDAKHQFLVEKLCSQAQPTQAQARTKAFHNPFVYWFQEVNLRKHFLVQLGWKDWMMHNVVKHDLRYLCDAGVDTIIPLHYWYHAYDVTIAKFIRTKKMRWHGMDKVSEVLKKIFGELWGEKYIWWKLTEKPFEWYNVTIYYTGTLDHLNAEKKRLWLLQKGSNIHIKSHRIEI